MVRKLLITVLAAVVIVAAGYMIVQAIHSAVKPLITMIRK